MNEQTDRKFTFNSAILPPETFGVVRFQGTEGLSACYGFDILLISKETSIDLREILMNPVTFTINGEGGPILFHGALKAFEQLHAVGESVYYRAYLIPRLSWMAMTKHNQVFLNKTIPEIVTACLEDGGLTSLDYELRLQKDYTPWEYVCQFDESHLDFISRWLEREGMYYYFEQDEKREKLIITDSKIFHTTMEQSKTVYYSPPSGLEGGHRDEVISAFFCRQQFLPRSVILKDYNYRRPSLDLTASAEVHPQGQGDVYIYGEHLRTPEEGSSLAKIRAEEILCWERRFDGKASVPYLRPGYTFDLRDHYRASFNHAYLTVHLTHEGNQAGYMLSGLGTELGEGEHETWYRNSFTVLPAEVQFRPERKTPKARIYGLLNAKVDAAGSGQYAELDEQGRYKIILPFDTSGRRDGKASTWVRMMQPYAGSDHGMHFPLHKDTEILLAFIDGDPDRPIIAGAAPNPGSPSLVNTDNQTKARLVSASGNEFHMEDQAGKERILLHSPATQTFVRLGQPNDPAVDWANPDINSGGKYGYTLYTSGLISITANTANTLIIGENTAMTLIDDNKFVGGLRTDATIGVRFNFPMLFEKKCGAEKTKWIGFRQKAVGSDVLVTGESVQAVGAVQRAVGNKVDAAAMKTKMKAMKARVTGTYTNAIGVQTRAIATKTEVAAAKTEAIGEAVTAAVAQSQVIADEASATANLATMSALTAKTRASVYKAAVSDVKAAANITHLRAERVKLTIQETMV
ncbi:MAG: type VI secretion system tip protein TssI/VgrG [Syntrophales bacterium]